MLPAVKLKTPPKIDPKIAAVVHILAMSLLSAPFFINGAMQQGWSCLLAGAIIGINLIALAWSMKRIFQKKSVALATSVIVIKYAILLGALILLQTLGWRMNIGFVVGLAALFPTIGYVAYKYTVSSGEASNQTTI